MNSMTNQIGSFNPPISLFQCVQTFRCTFSAGIYEQSRDGQNGAFLPEPSPLSLVSDILTVCIPNDSIIQLSLECS